MGEISDRVRLGLSNPELLARKISQHYNYFRSGTDYNSDGLDFIAQDWDILVILDACRWDVFEQLNTIEGTLRRVESRSSATPEFLRGNFRGKELLDTVYVTTNPMLRRHEEEIDVQFHEVVDLWSGETWNDENGTVLPEDTTEAATDVADKYPNKRLIVHYMQPHYPFINADFHFDKGHIGVNSPDGLTTWMQVMTGEIEASRDRLWDAYANNLRRVLPHVEELLDSVVGKPVVTSDHGNMFGERARPIPVREWGHPPGIWTKELVSVPWLEANYDRRRRVVSEPSTGAMRGESDPVSDRLEQLGYLD